MSNTRISSRRPPRPQAPNTSRAPATSSNSNAPARRSQAAGSSPPASNPPAASTARANRPRGQVRAQVEPGRGYVDLSAGAEARQGRQRWSVESRTRVGMASPRQPEVRHTEVRVATERELSNGSVEVESRARVSRQGNVSVEGQVTHTRQLSRQEQLRLRMGGELQTQMGSNLSPEYTARGSVEYQRQNVLQGGDSLTVGAQAECSGTTGHAEPESCSVQGNVTYRF